MAIKTYLYSGSSVTSDELEPYLIGGSPSVGASLGKSTVPVTIDEVHKEDLDDAMAHLGFNFVEEYTGGTAFTGRSDWGVFSADPTGLTIGVGDKYYNSVLQMEMRYDGLRSKWLSVESQRFQFGRDGVTAPEQYYRGADGRVLSSNIGWFAERSGTITSLSYTRSNTDATSFDIVANGSSLATVATSVDGGRNIALNADFSFGDRLAVRNISSGLVTEDVVAVLGIKWRG